MFKYDKYMIIAQRFRLNKFKFSNISILLLLVQHKFDYSR